MSATRLNEKRIDKDDVRERLAKFNELTGNSCELDQLSKGDFRLWIPGGGYPYGQRIRTGREMFYFIDSLIDHERYLQEQARKNER